MASSDASASAALLEEGRAASSNVDASQPQIKGHEYRPRVSPCQRTTWSNFVYLIHLGVGSLGTSTAWLCFLSCALQAACSALSFASYLVAADILADVLDGNAVAAVRSLVAASACYAILAMLQVLVGYVGEHIRVQFRERLTLLVHQWYFQHAVPYRLVTGVVSRRSSAPLRQSDPSTGRPVCIDNVDQRMTQDIDELSRELSTCFTGGYGAYSPLPSAFFGIFISLSYVTMQLSAIYVVFAFFFAMICTAVVTGIAGPVSRRFYSTDVSRGDLRAQTAHIAAHHGVISMWRGQQNELRRVLSHLQQFVRNSCRLYAWQWLQETWLGFQAGFPTTLAYVSLLTVMWVQGASVVDNGNADDDGGNPHISASEVMTAVAAASSLTAGLVGLPALWSQLTTMAGSVARVVEVVRGVEQLSTEMKADRDFRQQWRTTAQEPQTPVKAANNDAYGGTQVPGGGVLRLTNVDVILPELVCTANATQAPAKESGAEAPRGGSPASAILRHISLIIRRGESQLIVAPSGTGKTSLLRVLAGLWPGDASIVTGLHDPMTEQSTRPLALFVPSQPYLPPCSLRHLFSDYTEGADAAALLREAMTCHSVGVRAQQEVLATMQRRATCCQASKTSGICRHRKHRDENESLLTGRSLRGERRQLLKLPDTAVLSACLRAAGLGKLIPSDPLLLDDSLDAPVDWQNTLSFGEQQLLLLARIMYRKPVFAFLDDATTGVSPALESAALSALAAQGITVVSLGHKDTLIQQHAVVSALRRDPSGRAKGGALSGGSPGPGSNSSPAHEVATSEPLFPAATATHATAEQSVSSAAGKPNTLQFGMGKLLWFRFSAVVKLTVASCAMSPKRVFAAVALLAAAVLVSISLTFITVQVSYVPGKLLQAVLDGRQRDAWELAGLACLLYLLSPAIGALARALGKCVSLGWYRCMSEGLLQGYLSPSRCVMLSASRSSVAVMWTESVLTRMHDLVTPGGPADTAIDRLDQRMTADTESLAFQLGIILFGGSGRLSLLQVVATIAATTAAAADYGFRPVASCYAVALVSLAVSWLLSWAIPHAIALRELVEGLFRSSHQRVKLRAEPIAFTEGEAHEKCLADALLRGLVGVSLHQVQVELPVRLFANVIALCGTMLAYTFACVEASTGSLGRYPVDAEHLYGLANLLISLNLYICALPDYLSNFAEAAGSIHRVGSLIDKLNRASEDELQQGQKLAAVADVQSAAPAADTIACVESGPVHVPLQGKSDIILLKDAGFAVSRGQVTRLTAPTGSGKSTLQRILAGAAPTTEATAMDLLRLKLADEDRQAPHQVQPPQVHAELVMFAPQVPYMPLGSLLDAVTYPSPEPTRQDEEVQRVRRCLQDVGLWYHAREAVLRLLRVDTVSDVEVLTTLLPWAAVLSNGQHQRLVCARLLFHQPVCAILDESFTALPRDEAEALLAVLLMQDTAVVQLEQSDR